MGASVALGSLRTQPLGPRGRAHPRVSAFTEDRQVSLRVPCVSASEPTTGSEFTCQRAALVRWQREVGAQVTSAFLSAQDARVK